MHKLKPNYKMKALHRLFVLMIGLLPFFANAQKADSVIVIYDNQKTVIPVPAFGSQTTVKMADSIQIIEIGVLRKRVGDKSQGAVKSNDQMATDSKSETARKQVKWFSQLEVAYTKSFSAQSYWSSSTYTNQDGTPIKMVDDTEMGDINGYQLRVLLRENVTMLSDRFSFNSGFKIGYAQSFNNVFTKTTEYDTTGYMLSDTSHFYNFRSSSFQLVLDAGFAYHFQAFKSASRIFIGNSFSYTIMGVKDLNNHESGSSYLTSYMSLVQPYLGAEVGKFGCFISFDWGVTGQGIFNPGYPSYSSASSYPTLTAGLTFRFF